jgi:hypothetical protein
MGRKFIAGLAAVLLSAASWADFELYKDYEIKDTVVHMTTVKVNAGKGEDYIEGLAQTWVASNQVAKDLGQIEDFNIYVSRLPDSGQFNVVLITTMKSIADFVGNKKDYDAFMKKWGERRQQQSKETAKKYPELRTITGEYLLGEVELK